MTAPVSAALRPRRSRATAAPFAATLVALLAAGQINTVAAQEDRPVVVASKPFAESFILAEVFAQLLEARGFTVDR